MKKISVKLSAIPGAGMGLFADEHIKRGEQIVPIEGEKYSKDSEHELDSMYLLDSGDGSNDYIDVRGPAMYANDACGLARVPGLVNNCVFRLADDGIMWLEATRSIKAGQEIFASYGRAYWTAIRNLNKEKAELAMA